MDDSHFFHKILCMCQNHNFQVQKNVKIRQEKKKHYHPVFSLHFLFVAKVTIIDTKM
jgi:hypothetical protein